MGYGLWARSSSETEVGTHKRRQREEDYIYRAVGEEPLERDAKVVNVTGWESKWDIFSDLPRERGDRETAFKDQSRSWSTATHEWRAKTDSCVVLVKKRNPSQEHSSNIKTVISLFPICVF